MKSSPYFWSLLIASLFVMQCTSDSADVPELGEVLISDEVQMNPSGYAPLTAVISIETNIPTQLVLTVYAKTGEIDFIQPFGEIATQHELPVLGLFAEYNNQVQVAFFTSEGERIGDKEYLITTQRLSPDLPAIQINEVRADEMAPGWTLVSYFGHDSQETPQRAFMFDESGDIRWYLDFSSHPALNGLFYDNGIERLQNGNLYFGDRTTRKIYEINMLGEVLNTWDMPGYVFHHEVTEKPDGNFIALVSELGAPTVEDIVIEIDRQANRIVQTWDLKESLQQDRTTLTSDTRDWIHVNAVEYSEQDDCIILSGRTQGVIKLTRDNQVVWILGSHRGWRQSGRGEELGPYLLQPLDAQGMEIDDDRVKNGDDPHPDFEWNWYQHAPQIMPDGNLILFDNGDNRHFSGSGQYSRAVEYAIDEENNTVQQVWSYGKERGLGTYSRIVSDVDYDPVSNHVFFSPGAIQEPFLSGKVVEVDYTTMEVVFEATIRPPRAGFGIITLHRTERMPIYAP
ncbi:MAG: aryl-sulfate sulfotransferase [Bacteroidota bacterium]